MSMGSRGAAACLTLPRKDSRTKPAIIVSFVIRLLRPHSALPRLNTRGREGREKDASVSEVKNTNIPVNSVSLRGYAYQQSKQLGS